MLKLTNQIVYVGILLNNFLRQNLITVVIFNSLK